MAVSGSEFEGSVSKGSTGDFDHSCNPCLTTGQHIEAHGYCVHCREYLCKNCCTYHARLKVTKHHQLLDKSNMPRQQLPTRDSEVCKESCYLHRNAIIKYFCTQHEELGCADCIIQHHWTCSLEYISDKCADIGYSHEFREVVEKLDQKVKGVGEVMKLAKSRDKDIDISYDNIMKDVIKYRKDVNDRLDQHQNKIQADADKKKSTDKHIIQSVLATCTNVMSDMKTFQLTLQDNKTADRNEQLYIDIKRANSCLKLHEIDQVEESLAKTDMQYSFERNEEFEKMLSTQDKLGNLKLSVSLVPPRKKKAFDKLTNGEDIQVQTNADESDCFIAGCAVLSDNKTVLADRFNKKIKVVDTQSKSVLEEKTLDSGPWDIAVLPKDQIAVTIPDKQEILILTSRGILSTLRTIPVKGSCRGIDYHQDQLYVVCYDQNCVRILDTNGNVRNTVSLDNKIFSGPDYILFSETSKVIYISNFSSNSVVSITLQGKIFAIYKHGDLHRPVGMVMVDDGSLLVCSYLNGIIHHISGDLKQGQTLIECLQRPHSICYSNHQQEVYIGSLGCDQLNVFKLQ